VFCTPPGPEAWPRAVEGKTRGEESKEFVTIQVLFTKLEISNLRNFRNLRNYKALAPALSISEIS
jgi:hypothetical protein